MQDNHIFLAGDAAHIHSPAGGQGMNVGIQDAYNLAWKLALVIQYKAKTSLLDSYQLERFPVVHKIVDESEKLTKSMIFDKKFFAKLHTFSSHLSEEDNNKKFAEELCELNLQYKESPVIDYAVKTPSKAPRQGERLPNILVDRSKHLYQCFDSHYHTIFLFTGLDATAAKVEEVNALQGRFEKLFPGLIKTVIVSVAPMAGADCILDTDGAIHQHFNLKKHAAYLVRPDTYIAYFAKDWEPGPIEKVLNRSLEPSL